MIFKKDLLDMIESLTVQAYDLNRTVEKLEEDVAKLKKNSPQPKRRGRPVGSTKKKKAEGK